MTTSRGIRRALLFAASIVVGSQVVTACVDDRPEPCRTATNNANADGECGAGLVCSADGFCERECRYDYQCPCGSFCAPSCGLCILDDLSGPATCKATSLGYGAPKDTLGACRPDIARLLAEELDAKQVDATVEAGDASPRSAASTLRDGTGNRWSCRLELSAPQCTNTDADGAADASEAGESECGPECDAGTLDDADIGDASSDSADEAGDS